MTAKAALAKALLDGRVLNVRNCFTLIGLTNCAREISRMIEKDFRVTVSRVPRQGESRYGQPCTWTDYRLNRSEHNLEGIEKMKEYIISQSSEEDISLKYQRGNKDKVVTQEKVLPPKILDQLPLFK